MTKDEHLAHLLRLTAPPFTQNWARYAQARAQELAADVELADLPARLADAMQKWPPSKPSGPE